MCLRTHFKTKDWLSYTLALCHTHDTPERKHSLGSELEGFGRCSATVGAIRTCSECLLILFGRLLDGVRTLPDGVGGPQDEFGRLWTVFGRVQTVFVTLLDGFGRFRTVAPHLVLRGPVQQVVHDEASEHVVLARGVVHARAVLDLAVQVASDVVAGYDLRDKYCSFQQEGTLPCRKRRKKDFHRKSRGLEIG